MSHKQTLKKQEWTVSNLIAIQPSSYFYTCNKVVVKIVPAGKETYCSTIAKYHELMPSLTFYCTTNPMSKIRHSDRSLSFHKQQNPGPGGQSINFMFSKTKYRARQILSFLKVPISAMCSRH